MEKLPQMLNILVPIMFGAIGYYLRMQLEKKEKLNEKIVVERRELYQKFIDYLVKSIKTPGENNRAEIIDFCKKFILYASPNVVVQVNELIKSINTESKEELIKSYTILLNRIILSMRRDIGLSNRGIHEKELLTLLIN